MVPETERLVRSMVSTEPLSDETTGTPQSPVVRLLGLIEGETVARPPIAPFVGRERELDLLVAAFERVAASGAPGMATVIGAPGVGKSRLVAESFARMSGRARILRSRCLPYGDGITYWPVRELVVAATGIAPGEPRSKALAKLDAIVARLDRGDLVRSRVASIIGLADDPVPGEEIAWAVRRFIEALALDGPLVLLVDDLQWAEPALLEALDHVQDAGQGPILLVTVARPELEEMRPDVLARPSLVLIRLDALDPSDAATLLDHLAPELPPGPLRSRIVATTEGNPSSSSSSSRSLRRRLGESRECSMSEPTRTSRSHRRSGRSWPLASTACRRSSVSVLERAAVVGRSFWASAVADLIPVDERAGLPRHLAHLARRDLIRAERSDTFDDEGFRFRHLLIRDAAYGALPKRKRADLHERFAGWLERHWAAVNPGEYDLIVGYHLEQAYRYRVELGDALEDARAACRACPAVHRPGRARRRSSEAIPTLLHRSCGGRSGSARMTATASNCSWTSELRCGR